MADIHELRPSSSVHSAAANREQPVPKGFTAESAKWWRKIIDEYSIDDEAGLLLLQTALESFQRMRSAQRAVRKDGQMIRDRFGQQRAHPLLAVERDARAQMLAALKALNLDLEPTGKPGRPGGR